MKTAAQAPLKDRPIKDLSEMREFAGTVASHYSGERLIILLYGPVGAGKTQFTKFLVEALGSSEACSPSFAIHNSYESTSGPVEHIDLYRIESEDDLESTGFWDFFRSSSGLMIIEWAERLEEMGLASQLPKTWPQLAISIDVGANAERAVRIG